MARITDQTLTTMLRAMADPTRRRILKMLKQKGACSIGDKNDVGLCASDIEQHVSLTQPTVSHHMSVLKKAGLIEVTRQGQWMWYRRHESALRELARIMKEEI